MSRSAHRADRRGDPGVEPRGRHLGRRRWLAAAALLALPSAWAQSDWQRRPVPAYAGQDVVAGALRGAYLPWAQAFEKAAAHLQRALDTPTDTAIDTPADAPAAIDPARSAWTEALVAWSRLSAVAIGPLVTRRSARRIDFHPTRPALIRQTIGRASALAATPPAPAAAASAEADAAALDLVGSAAKGFAALEWLLWDPQAPTDRAAAAYRRALADDLRHEAHALVDAFDQLSRTQPQDEALSTALLDEWVNQWLGGLEQLRLQGLVRPVQEARSRGRGMALLPRAASGSDAAERNARWEALVTLGLYGGPALPIAGQGLVPLETWLRAKGLNPLADQLRQRLLAAGQALQRGRDEQSDSLLAAAATLADLGHWVQAEVTPRLDIRIGFSDADGD